MSFILFFLYETVDNHNRSNRRHQKLNNIMIDDIIPIDYMHIKINHNL